MKTTHDCRAGRAGRLPLSRYVEPVKQVSVGVDEMIQQTVQVGTASMAPCQIAVATSAGPARAGQ